MPRPLKRDRDSAEIIARLHAESWRETYRGIYSDHFLDVAALEERRDFWSRRFPALRSAIAEVFLARMAGEPAGFSCIEIDGAQQPGAYIESLYVLRRFQAMGIGRGLVTAALDWARARGEHEVRLQVLESNQAARAFYARAGWRVEARRLYSLSAGGRTLHPRLRSADAPVLRLIRSI